MFPNKKECTLPNKASNTVHFSEHPTWRGVKPLAMRNPVKKEKFQPLVLSSVNLEIS